MKTFLTAAAIVMGLMCTSLFAATTQPQKDFYTSFSEKWEQFKDKVKESEPVKAAREKYEKMKDTDQYKSAREQYEKLKQDEKVQQKIAEAKEKAKATGSRLLDKAKDFFGVTKK